MKKTKLPFKESLYLESPFCRKCGVKLTMEHRKVTPDTFFTIQHNKPKAHPEYDKDKTLWCFKCNNEDATFKHNNNILSDIHVIKSIVGGVNGKMFLVDDYHLYSFSPTGHLKRKNIIDFKLEKFSRYMEFYLDGKVKSNFEDYIESYISAKISIKQYYIGDGWYRMSKNKGYAALQTSIRF